MNRNVRIHTDRILVSGIEVEVHRKRIKNMHLSVLPPEGSVRISAPLHTRDEAIQSFVIKKSSWIKRHVDRIQSQPKPAEPEYVSGEIFDVWGRLCILEILCGRVNRVEIDGDRLIMTVREGSTSEQRQRIMTEWYRRQLKAALPELIQKWENIVGVEAGSVRVKNMRTRWGTCNTKEKRIWISLRLAQKHPECLEYVVVHELVHLREKGHNAVFYGYMDQYLPDWRSIRHELNHPVNRAATGIKNGEANDI
ncbi:MAG: SprT family zinc-dependent metalloprotease [Eubacteriales bacterium]|jgi:predicted metal-dependent hydrolase|nr:SprT family zinc-dependent metalloprotease [Eubacteriales bacterium]